MEDIKQCPNEGRIKHHPFATVEKECQESKEKAIDTRMTTECIPTGIDERIIRPFNIGSFEGQGSKERIDHLNQAENEEKQDEPAIGFIKHEIRSSWGENKKSSQDNEKHPKGKQNIELIIPMLYFIEVKEGEDDKTKAAKNDVFHEFPLFAVIAL